MTDNNKKIIEMIENAENINRLPLYDDFKKAINDEDFESLYDEDYDEIGWKEITIKDGTKVILERNISDNNCFKDRDHWDFYHIVNDDSYICLECGLRQKVHEYGSFCSSVSLPADWNEHGIKVYLQRRIEKEEERSRESRLRYEERIRLYADCSNCIHMKHDECEYCNEEYSDEFCEDWEER